MPPKPPSGTGGTTAGRFSGAGRQKPLGQLLKEMELINEAQIQPQVFVHKDFHSRNLMVLPEGKSGPGVIDFQDARRGPIGYDLVSLLKDCYISWSRERVERWVKGYRRVLGNLGANVGDSEYQFLRWFDLIGVQRHVKVLGVFARLWHRDGKIGYLDDLPLVLEYVLDACRRYPELVEFGRWLDWRVAPQLAAANQRQKDKAARAAAAALARQARRARKPRKPKKKVAKPARKVSRKPVGKRKKPLVRRRKAAVPKTRRALAVQRKKAVRRKARPKVRSKVRSKSRNRRRAKPRLRKHK